MHSLSDVLAWHFAPGVLSPSLPVQISFLLSAPTVPNPAGLPGHKTTLTSLSPLSPCHIHSTPSVWLLEGLSLLKIFAQAA